MRKLKIIAVLFGLTGCWCNGMAQTQSGIFPVPSEIQWTAGHFVFDSSTFVVSTTTGKSEFLSTLFIHELADKYGFPVQGRKVPVIKTADKCVLIGTINDPLVRNYCTQNKLIQLLQQKGREGYLLSITENKIVVAANDDAGALWGLSSLRQMIQKEKVMVTAPRLKVLDAPAYSFRGIKLYLPGKENIQFFKRFIRDFAVLYKYNTIILELNANMRLQKHPELNVGAVEFAKHLKYSRLDRPPGIHREYQNSSHQDNADGQVMEKEEVAGLVAYMRSFGMEVIPELPSLTHSYYLLAAHRQLAENLLQPYPDTYCPLKPGSYQLYFDVLDEYIEVIRPKMIHVGHDEWRMEKDICEWCRGKDYGQLFVNDLKKIHGYLAKKGIKTAIWGDHLLESVTQKDHQLWKSSTGYTYKIPGALRPDQVRQLPKDILVFNWFWNDPGNDKQVAAFGFKQVLGNLRADIGDWNTRSGSVGLLGGAPSSWAATTELNFGKDQLFDFIGCANLLWSTRQLPADSLAFAVMQQVPAVYRNLSGITLPADDGALVVPLDISMYMNGSLADTLSGRLTTGRIAVDNKYFNAAPHNGKDVVLADERKAMQAGIPVNADASSLVFFHACKNEAINNKAYTAIFNFDDTAEPLAFYEVLYEDGITVSIPLRYGLNILDWQWKQRIVHHEKEKVKYNQSKYAYQASAAEVSADPAKPVTFFAYEWINPRYGKEIKQVRLVATGTAKSNPVALMALSMTKRKEATAATGTEAQ